MAAFAAVCGLTALTAPSSAASKADSAASATPPFTSIVGRHQELHCVAGDVCSFDASKTTNTANGATAQARVLLQRTHPLPGGYSSLNADAGFAQAVPVPAGARSVSATFYWKDVVGSAFVVGGIPLRSHNQFYLRLVARATGCDAYKCEVVAPLEPSGENPLLASSTLGPPGNMKYDNLMRTVTIRARDGFLPPTVGIESYFDTGSGTYLSDVGKVEASYSGRLHRIEVVIGT